MSEVRVNNLSNENNTSGPTISGITTFSSPYFFVPPQGDTASRPSDCEPGSFRFNTDSAKLEYFRGNTIGWTEIEAELTAPLGGGTGSNTGLGVRGIVGAYNVNGDTIEFLTVSTLGNTQDFGNLTAGRNNPGQQVSNESTMLFMGGYTPSGWANIIDFITVGSLGNATDFGDLTVKRMQQSSVNNKIRGITGGGQTAPNYSGTNVIDYVTIAQTGNAVDFGDTTNAKLPSLLFLHQLEVYSDMVINLHLTMVMRILLQWHRQVTQQLSVIYQLTTGIHFMVVDQVQQEEYFLVDISLLI